MTLAKMVVFIVHWLCCIEYIFWFSFGLDFLFNFLGLKYYRFFCHCWAVPLTFFMPNPVNWGKMKSIQNCHVPYFYVFPCILLYSTNFNQWLCLCSCEYFLFLMIAILFMCYCAVATDRVQIIFANVIKRFFLT